METTSHIGLTRSVPFEAMPPLSPKTNANRANQWGEVIKEFNRSGASAKRYSAETGVSYCQLLYWARKLGASELSQQAGTFKELRVIGPRSEYRLKLINNRELIIPSWSSALEVAELADALEARA